MSSTIVRQAFREGWAALIPDVPYFNSNNASPLQNGLPDLWVTMIFEAQRERITIGGHTNCYREVGTCAVVIMTKAGTSDEQATQLVDRVCDQFLGYSGANGQMQVVNIQPPNDGINEVPAKSSFYRTLVELDYRFDRYA